MIKSTKFRGELLEGPDSQGRYHYVLFWMQEHAGDKVAGIQAGEVRERGQHYFGVPPVGVEMKDRRGK